MVRKAIVSMCTVLVLSLGASAWAQTATDSSKTTTSKKTTSTSYSSTKKGQMCGGIAGTPCPTGEACKYPVNQCNVADLAGMCVKVPETCKKGGAKVCGCDNKTYDNECELLKAGIHELHRGACKAAATK